MTINKDSVYQVKNRSASMVIYSIPEDNIRREFTPGETKKIPYLELEKLSYQAGGREIMSNFLQLKAEELTQEFGIKREPEYDMSEEQVIALLQSDSLDSFLDALDFAPIGVIDLIKTFAVQLPLNNIEKREALKKKTGFDVALALTNLQKEREAENTEANKTETTTARRVQPAEKKQEARRTTTQYKVVTPKE